MKLFHTQNLALGYSTEQENCDSGLKILFLAAFPMLLWMFQGTGHSIATSVLLIVMFTMGLRLISRGQQVHRDYAQASFARRPVLPRKIVGSVLIGLVTFVLAGHHFDALMMPAAFGVTAVILSLAAFGVDPMADKGEEIVEETVDPKIQAFVERHVAAITQAVLGVEKLGDEALTHQTGASTELVLAMLEAYGEAPEDLGRLRKPIEKFTAILSEEVARLTQEQTGDGAGFARRRFLAKLDVLRETLESRATQSGLPGQKDAFDHQAEELLDRMPRESAA